VFSEIENVLRLVIDSKACVVSRIEKFTKNRIAKQNLKIRFCWYRVIFRIGVLVK
jgi:hypothetical protein